MNKIILEENLIISSKQTIDLFIEEKNCGDLIALYIFYYYTAKWQKTNQPKAVDKYVKNGLHWGFKKFNNAQKFLIEKNLIEKICQRNKKGQITGWYIKINYIWKQKTIENIQNSQKPVVDNCNNDSQKPVVSKATCGFQTTNALSANSINALSANKEMLIAGSKNSPALAVSLSRIRGLRPTPCTFGSQNLLDLHLGQILGIVEKR